MSYKIHNFVLFSSWRATCGPPMSLPTLKIVEPQLEQFKLVNNSLSLVNKGAVVDPQYHIA